MNINHENLFEKYIPIMKERIKEATKEDHIIHGFMVYQCLECGSVYVMWLEKGLEDPEDDAKTGKHKPVPFAFPCICCGGDACHSYWSLGQDSLSKNYRSYNNYVNKTINKPVYRNFFWNDPDSECGYPVIFEPDYRRSSLQNVEGCLAEIYLNTLPNEVYEKIYESFNQQVSYESMSDVIFVDDVIPKANRQSKRHPNGDDGYKRPRKNKKLYEY